MAFDWLCDDNAGVGPVHFYTRGLKEQKNLSDLILPSDWKLNRVAIVTLGSGVINISGHSGAFQGNTSNQFFWLEGNFKCTDSPDILRSMTRAMVRNIRSTGCGSLTDGGMSRSYFHNIYFAHGDVAITLEGSIGNSFYKIFLNNLSDGIYHTDSEHRNIFQELTINNISSFGINIANNQDSHYIGITLTNTGSFTFDSVGTTNLVVKNVFTLNTNSGLNIFSGSRTTVENSTFSNVSIFNSSNNKFTGNLIYQNSVTDCVVFGGTNPGLQNGTCANQGSSNATFVLDQNFGLNSFVGSVSTDDSLNSSDIAGAQSYLNILDWTQFENPYRNWAPDFPFGSVGAQSKCSSGTCRIFDFSLLQNDTIVKNSTVSVGFANAAFIHGVSCPAQLHGNIVTQTAKAAPVTYLTHAREIFGSGGNNNGLCESNETCLYLPNYGAYQGSGDFWANQCVFQNGTVSGVSMFAYPIN